MFAIIGFALGIILSQKIGTTYSKYLQVEEILFRLRGTLASVVYILDGVEKGLGTKAVKKWLRVFLDLFEDEKADHTKIIQANRDLYGPLQKAESSPAEMAILSKEISADSEFCLSKKNSFVPLAYDNLLKQSTILYLVMTAVFIPGITGLISVFLATYMLYGMYHVTVDLDSLVGGDYNLIDINSEELHTFYTSLK